MKCFVFFSQHLKEKLNGISGTDNFQTTSRRFELLVHIHIYITYYVRMQIVSSISNLPSCRRKIIHSGLSKYH